MTRNNDHIEAPVMFAQISDPELGMLSTPGPRVQYNLSILSVYSVAVDPRHSSWCRSEATAPNSEVNVLEVSSFPLKVLAPSFSKKLPAGTIYYHLSLDYGYWVSGFCYHRFVATGLLAI
ncbi:hypothetical protein J6590_061666 [Homalodisca vitripennis]|nr:hypothetical protein J6590_061666 [Homalodisca vitripennis]